MKTILFKNYCMTRYLSGNRKVNYDNATWYFHSTNLFSFISAISIFIISKIEYKLSYFILLFILAIIFYVSYYANKKSTINTIHDDNFSQRYNLLTKNNRRIAIWLGLLMTIGSFALFMIIGIIYFEGYAFR